MDGLRFCYDVIITTTEPIRLRIITTTHVWGDYCVRASSRIGSRRYCRYMCLKSKRVSSNVTLTRLPFFVAFGCQFFGRNNFYHLTSTLC